MSIGNPNVAGDRAPIDEIQREPDVPNQGAAEDSDTQNAETQESKPEYTNVVFSEPEQNTDSGEYIFKSPNPGGKEQFVRKAIVLASDSPKPVPGQSYRVRIIRDTHPTNPKKGKLIGVVVPDDEVILTKAWQEAEDNVNEAELQQRTSRRAAHTLHRRTGIPFKNWEPQAQATMLQELPAEQRSSVRARLERMRNVKESVQTLLGELNTQENALIRLRQRNLRDAVEKATDIEKRHERLLLEESEIRRGISEVTPPDLDDIAALRQIDEIKVYLENELKDLLASTPEAFYGLHLRKLKEYKDNLLGGRIIETPYVKKQAEEVLTYLRAGKPVFIHGHLGSGKTELALHVARTYIGKEPLVISGSKHTSLPELYGGQVLRLDQVNDADRDQFISEVWTKFEDWKKLHPEADEAEQDRMHKTIFETYLTKFQNGTVSGWWLGPVYEAMAQGRPIIIDEVNAIPHEVLISLNHALTRRVGEKIHAQQAGGEEITVREGFGIIMTGNVNQGDERYIARENLDIALLSRVHTMEHDYLPQSVVGTRDGEAGEGNELYHVLLAKVMDRNGNISAPEDAFDTLWRLAKVSRLVEDVFAGRQVESNFYYRLPGKRAIQMPLTENVLSLRHLDTIIGQWQNEGYVRELDYYIWGGFISQIHNPVEKAYLYQLFQEQFNFFQGDGWPSGIQEEDIEAPGDSEAVKRKKQEARKRRIDYDAVTQGGAFIVNPPKNISAEENFFGPRQVVEAAFGHAPERKAWPAGKKKVNESEKAAEPVAPSPEQTEQTHEAYFLPERDLTIEDWDGMVRRLDLDRSGKNFGELAAHASALTTLNPSQSRFSLSLEDWAGILKQTQSNQKNSEWYFLANRLSDLTIIDRSKADLPSISNQDWQRMIDMLIYQGQRGRWGDLAAHASHLATLDQAKTRALITTDQWKGLVAQLNEYRDDDVDGTFPFILHLARLATIDSDKAMGLVTTQDWVRMIDYVKDCQQRKEWTTLLGCAPSLAILSRAEQNIREKETKLKKIVTFFGAEVELTGKKTNGRRSVGDLLKVAANVVIPNDLLMSAKKIEVVGFDADGRTVVQVDGSKYTWVGQETPLEKVE